MYEVGGSVVTNREAQPARILIEREGQVALSCTSGSKHQDVQVTVYPFALSEIQNEATIQPRCAIHSLLG